MNRLKKGWPLLLVAVAWVTFEVGHFAGYKAGLADGTVKSTAQKLVLQKLSEDKVELPGGNRYKLATFLDGDHSQQYVCGKVGRWGSAATGFEEPQNALEVLNTDRFEDLDGRLVGVIRDIRR